VKQNIPEFTVSEFSRSIKRVVEDSFGYVRIKGEISSFKKAASGHLYFSLKDENSLLSAVFFRNAAQMVAFEVADGLQVCASGRITTFEGRSNYQIIIEKLEIAGVGAILEMIEKRRQKLIAEGLFDEIHKKPIPFFPKTIGVITSETGAVIEDIKHRIEARCPTHLMIFSTLVQGDKAAAQIIEGVRFFNRMSAAKRPEVLIIARGGGSFEDLMPFNDENLVREIFKSEIPVISAIGHETDTTLIDYVADLRAPTPTAAAELATPILFDLKSRLNFLSEKITLLPQNFLQQHFLHLKNLQRYIVDPSRTLLQIEEKFLQISDNFNFSVQRFLEKRSQKIAAIHDVEKQILQRFLLLRQRQEFAFKSLNLALRNRAKEAKMILENLSKLLKSNHYREVLKRGFALIKNKNDHLVSSISSVSLNEEITVELDDGKITTQILNVKNS
jgi:exodeoxyribonuclease VII large subunit